MEKKSSGKRPLIFYYAIALLVLMLINTFITPQLLERQVEEVGYNDFLQMVDEGKVETVSMESDQIRFISKEDGKEKYYKTGIWPDEGLTQRLTEKNVAFASEIPTQSSPLLAMLLSWVFPLLLLWGVGTLMFKKMKNLGGNAMTFGKSNAKIYAENETGKTFSDVAG